MLQPAINMGLSEFDFWNMTKAEIERHLEGAVWQLKSKAQFDYLLADLIGVSVARILDSKAEYPPIEKAYSFLFEDTVPEANEEEIRMENSMNRFMEFALKHNAKLREGVNNINDDNRRIKSQDYGR